MNPVLWASMQPLEVVLQVDLMLPELVDEEQLELLEVIRPIKERAIDNTWFQNIVANGGVLTAVGLTILMIPDPIIYGIGFTFGGPLGGWIAVAVVNVVGFGLILLDQFI